MNSERLKFLLQNKFPFALLCGLVINMLALCNAFAEASNDTKLFFLGNKNIAPVVYLDGTTPSGVAVDIVHALAKHIPQPIEIKAMDWSEAQALVARGEADALIQINPTEERTKIYDFSDTLLESHFSIFTRSDKMGIAGLSSLRGLQVGVESGGLPQKLLNKDPQIRLTIIPNFPAGFRSLKEGSVDAVVVDYWVGSYILAEKKIRNIKVSGEPIQSSYSSIAVKKGNTKLLNEINNALRIIKTDGTYQNILDNWKPKEGVFQTYQQIKERMYFVTVLILLLLFLIAVIWMLTLKKELAKRKTAEEKLARYRGHLEELVQERTAQLEETRNRARQYLDIAGVILVVIDADRRVTLINQKGCEVLQSTSAEIIGKDWFETFVPQNVRRDVREVFLQLMAGDLEPVEYFENPVLTQNGQERLIAWHNVLLRDGEGHIAGTLSSGEDITEQRRTENHIISLNQDLQKRAAALQASNKELDAFAYTVSHDLRVPLRHIDGFIELLRKNSGTVIDEQGRHYMTAISDAANKMGLLIDDLLSFSRMGRQAMSFQQVELGILVREVIRGLEPDTAGRSIEWCIADLPAVRCDAAMMRIVLGNLIANALKFTPPQQQAQIEIGSLPGQASGAVIFVRDNGVGFDMTYADKLFGVFQRLHRADEFEGTGIGLANVRRIIARHGGRTWAEGKVDQGATFYFSLPYS